MFGMAHKSRGGPTALLILVAVQMACAVFFVNDVVSDYFKSGASGLDVHLGVEMVATLSLVAAIVVEIAYLKRLLRRKSRLESSLKLASAEVDEVIRSQFEGWRLSPSETDIAMFLVKGLGTQEIAALRESAEGTVKAHINGIFRKSGTHSRAELLSAIIDKLLGERLDRQDPTREKEKRPAQ